MTATDLFETELGDQLRRRAAAAPVGDGWDSIRRCARRHERRRRAVRVASGSLAAVVVAAGVGAALLGGGGRAGLLVATAPAGSLPRLVVDLPSHKLAYIYAEDAAVDQPAPPAALPGSAPSTFTLVLAQPGKGWDGKVLFAQAVPPSVGFGFGEANPGATTVNVNGNDGYLGVQSALVTSLGWKYPNGYGLQGMYLVGLGLSAEEMVAAARSIEPEVVTAPSGVTVSFPPGPHPWRPGALAGGTGPAPIDRRPLGGRLRGLGLSGHAAPAGR